MKAGTESKLNGTDIDELANMLDPDNKNYSEGESPPPGTGQFAMPFGRLP